MNEKGEKRHLFLAFFQVVASIQIFPLFRCKGTTFLDAEV